MPIDIHVALQCLKYIIVRLSATRRGRGCHFFRKNEGCETREPQAVGMRFALVYPPMKPRSRLAGGVLLFLAVTGASCARPDLQIVTGQGTVVSAVPPRTAATAAKGREPLTIKLSAHVAPEPADVVARVRVEPDLRSRGLTIEWWTLDGVGGSHLITLDGDRAAIRHDYPIKGMEAGEYVVTARLTRNDGSQVKREARVNVVGGRTFTDDRF